MNKEHKNKDKDNYKDKDAKKITLSLTECYIFGRLISDFGNDFSTFRLGVTSVSVKKFSWPVKKSSPFPLWGHRLTVKALALSARRLDNILN